MTSSLRRAYNMGPPVRSKKMAVSAFREVTTGYWTYPAENGPHRSWQIVPSHRADASFSPVWAQPPSALQYLSSPPPRDAHRLCCRPNPAPSPCAREKRIRPYGRSKVGRSPAASSAAKSLKSRFTTNYRRPPHYIGAESMAFRRPNRSPLGLLSHLEARKLSYF